MIKIFLFFLLVIFIVIGFFIFNLPHQTISQNALIEIKK